MHTAHCSAAAPAFRWYSNAGMASTSSWLRRPPPSTCCPRCPTGTATCSAATESSSCSGAAALK
uniref:Uncharacterized protein n=1 Tax=Arundo donax TaxID=35708 RepID=A0A0A8YA38_ARUDO